MDDSYKIGGLALICGTVLLIVLTVCITYYNVVDRKEPGRVYTGTTSFEVK